LVDLSYKV